jgi:osmotically-inducible protein OsmY
VTLRGEVESEEDRERALRIARDTEGVIQVEDLLRVQGEAVATTGAAAERAPRQDAQSPAEVRQERPDLWITTQIQSKYSTDGEVRARNIEVDTRGGVVTLRGTVGDYAVRRQAVALARNTEGVREVRDELQVDTSIQEESSRAEGGPIDDAWIETKIQAKYFLEPDVKGRMIDVNVEGGSVTLTGNVESEQQKTTAEEIAAETDGVKQVQNQLEVRAPASQ